MIEITRRKFFKGLGLLIAAPAIIKVAGIMPIKVWAQTAEWMLFNPGPLPIISMIPTDRWPTTKVVWHDNNWGENSITVPAFSSIDSFGNIMPHHPENALVTRAVRVHTPHHQPDIDWGRMDWERT